jgi:caspase domain-containing protein
MFRSAAAFLMLILLSSTALADKRVALLIGNGTYEKVPQLANPSRDAAAMERLLQAAGFDVVQVMTDLGAVGMRRALRDFSDRARDSDFAVIFYAGHGMEVNGTNYLIPVDAALERDIDVEDEAVSLDRVMQMLEQAKRLRLVILDACRDNPFLRSMTRTTSSRSIGRGLAKVEVLLSDTLVAFAAKAGSTAADGEGANSPYTTALVQHLTAPGVDLRLALGRVRDEVLRSTGGRQEPFVYGSLGGEEIALAKAQNGAGQGRFMVLRQASWNKLCIAYPLPEVLTVKAPKHGKIAFGESVAKVRHAISGSPRCVGVDMMGREVYYEPSAGGADLDEVSFEVLAATGKRWGYDCIIRIRSQRADCRRRR